MSSFSHFHPHSHETWSPLSELMWFWFSRVFIPQWFIPCVLAAQSCLFVTPHTAAYQTPLFMGFSRQEYWSRLPCPPPQDLPNPKTEPRSPSLQKDSLPSEPPGKPYLVAAAKPLQLCPILCELIDGSPPGSSFPGILQARPLEWVAISFSNAWKWKVKVKLFSRIRLFATPRSAAYQAPQSMGFSRQEYWIGWPLPSPTWLLEGQKSGGGT